MIDSDQTTSESTLIAKNNVQVSSLKPQAPSLAAATLAVFRKDLRIELRSRYALNALLLFAVSTVVAISLGLGPIAPRDNRDLKLIQAALMWVALLFAAFTGLARAFVQEEDTRTATALRLAAPPLAVYLGKLLFNLLLLLVLDAVIAALFIAMLRVGVGAPLMFAAVLAVGSCALVAATTLIAAIIARASAKGALFAVLSFPLLIPPLVVAIRGTAFALEGESWAVGAAPIQVLLAYTLALFVASLFLFKSVWEA
ncbi:MAG: heme exporter protein CcmB [Roseiflexaceae bacterium]|nr:heme exporter protein CcmB [Roseiflexaceae bacterium]